MFSMFLILLLSTTYTSASLFFEDDDDRPIWTARERFHTELGYTELPCTSGNHWDRVIWKNDTSSYEIRPAECCACRAIVDHFEFLLWLQVRRLPEEMLQAVPTSWRMGQHKRSGETVPFERHMDLILHLMPNACLNLSLAIPAEETRLDKFKSVLENSCDDLYEQFEDQIGKAYYNNMTTQTDTLCGDKVIAACGDFVLEYEYEEEGER